jgi:hypothetical protein
MKRIILTLCCFFIVLSSLADAARFYKCVDRDGNTIMTDNPPPDVTCQSKGAERDLTPQERESERARRKNDRQIEAANEKIEALINKLMNDPRNLQTQDMGRGVIKTGGLKQHVLEQIVELRKAQLRNQGSTPNGNQQADMEDKMKRQQRELEDKKRQQEAEIHRQEREIRDLKSQKEWADHKARWNIK